MKITFKNNITAEPIAGQQLICPDGLCTLIGSEPAACNHKLWVKINVSGVKRWYDPINIEYLAIPGRLPPELKNYTFGDV
jgi:hypothetical protein